MSNQSFKFLDKELIDLKSSFFNNIIHNPDAKFPHQDDENFQSFAIHINTLDTAKFFKSFIPTIEKSNFNDYFKESKFQEYNLLSLCNLMNKALAKFDIYNKQNINESGHNRKLTYSSQFILVNDIIKNSPELISCLYLLEWQCSLYKFKNDIELKGEGNLENLIDEDVSKII